MHEGYTRRCGYRSCGVEFTPKAPQQYYCCREHAQYEANARYRDRSRQLRQSESARRVELLKRLSAPPQKRRELPKRICAQCGQEFTPQHKDAKYCGDRCRSEAKRERSRLSAQRCAEKKRTERAAAAARGEQIPCGQKGKREARLPCENTGRAERPKKVTPRNQLERDVMAAQRAGMSYGKYMNQKRNRAG